MWPARFSIAAMLVMLLVPAMQAVASGSHRAIPPEVLAGAREYAVSKVGEEFFESYMEWSPDLSSFRQLDPRYLGRFGSPDWLRHSRYIVIYLFRIPGKSFINEFIVLNIHEDGGWFDDTASDEGLPDCAENPLECEFPIDEEAALEIARTVGLQQGIEPWRADFNWGRRAHKTYVWEVWNTLGDRRGERVIIDANDGAVLDMSEWRVEID